MNRSCYAYLLGLYLGDGHIAEHPRGVLRLRIFLDCSYPALIAECRKAVASVSVGRPLTVGVADRGGCVYVNSYWKHWTCLFPQHGPGPKHRRPIVLDPWQDDIVRSLPARFLRGLIHSDGCRIVNRVRGKGYPRYMFCNHSADLIGLFCRACDDFGVSWTRPSWRTVSVAKARDVARLDEVVGPKK